MCGFIGILSESKEKLAAFAAGCSAIRARGTMFDVYEADGEKLGYTRLPTDGLGDASIGRINNTNGNLLFNGLVTNVEYLVEHFNLPLHCRLSDTTCLRVGLTTVGSKLLTKTRGMFALALVTKRTVILARDTVGIKPLYFAHADNCFAFASELKALCPLGIKVQEVLPGQIICFDRMTKKITKQVFAYQSYKTYTYNELEACLSESVIEPTLRYLEQSKTKKVGILLSGGLDSSIIASLLAAKLPFLYKKRLLALCLGNETSADVAIAKRLARDLRLDFVHVKLPADQLAIQCLPIAVYNTESPYARAVRVALLYDVLAKEVRRHDIDVVIGGEGADELFFGYRRFIDGLTPEQSEKLFNLFLKEVFPRTLLQRFDRSFARQQIEGRVPYLDQEMLALAASIRPTDKVLRVGSCTTDKAILRQLARQLGLDRYICQRPKQKMTEGATGQQNEIKANGYLERAVQTATGITFETLTTILYRCFFGRTLQKQRNQITEDHLARLTKVYQQLNAKQGVHL